MNPVFHVFQEDVIEHVFARGVHASIVHVYVVSKMIDDEEGFVVLPFSFFTCMHATHINR